MLVAIGLCALGIALTGTGVQVLALDPEPAVNGFDAILADPDGRRDLEVDIATAIEDGLVGDQLAAVAAAFELDVTAESERLAPLILADPAVQDAMRELVMELHGRVLVSSDGPPVDYLPLTVSARAVIDAESPRLGAIIPPGTTLWTVDPASLPDLTGQADLIERTVPLAFLLALLVGVGAAVHPRRHLVASWTGRWALGFGLSCALAAVMAPQLGEHLTGSSAVAVAVRSESLRLLAPAGLAAVLGTGLISLTTVARRREERTVIEEGTAAALGYDEPPLWQQTTSPSLDLASRGLVDANRPLTNI